MSEPNVTIFGLPVLVTVDAPPNAILIHPLLFGDLLNSLPNGTEILLKGKKAANE